MADQLITSKFKSFNYTQRLKIYSMLQRIQTIYLFLVIVVDGVLPFFIPIWTNGKSKIYLMFDQKYTAITGLILALVFISIISFKKNNINLF